MLTIATTSSQTIDSAPAHYLWPGEFVRVESDGANWTMIGRTPIIPNNFMLRNSTNDRRYLFGSPGTNLGLLLTTTSPAANTLWALPFILAKTTKIDTISFRLTTVGVGNNSRCGIYRDNGNCYPGALIFDTGSIDCSASAALKNTTITAGLQVFPPGLYWGAWETSAANIQIVGISGNGGLMGFLGYDNTLFNIQHYGYSVAHTYGTLPDPYTASATLLTAQPTASVPVPAITWRPI
jgi:hypothetical protein